VGKQSKKRWEKFFGFRDSENTRGAEKIAKGRKNEIVLWHFWNKEKEFFPARTNSNGIPKVAELLTSPLLKCNINKK
jgi:hypothetical protein